jgi:hypothetical protein
MAIFFINSIELLEDGKLSVKISYDDKIEVMCDCLNGSKK